MALSPGRAAAKRRQPVFIPGNETGSRQLWDEIETEKRMNVSHRNIVERIARVLAGRELSVNAEGGDPSAAAEVEASWPRYVEDAVAVLKTMREPDENMAEAGDPVMWERMIRAALPEGELA
jgi:hypothetical protein